MADEADRAQILEEAEREHGIKISALPLAKGKPGECRLCGLHFERLIDGACGGCRDQAAHDEALRRQRRLRG